MLMMDKFCLYVYADKIYSVIRLCQISLSEVSNVVISNSFTIVVHSKHHSLLLLYLVFTFTLMMILVAKLLLCP